MTPFTEYFWGEKSNGFDVLYHNMKNGQVSSKEFSDFLRESCSVEENYAKLLNKLAIKANNCGAVGSFSPFWQLLKALTEKVSNLHLQLVHSWQDLIKDVQRYSEEQHKKHKSMKDSESSTLEVVQSIQHTTVALQKAKEIYHARSIEYDKLKRESGTQKELERAEAKYKKAHDEYRSLVDKYATVRADFEKKMTESCRKFQETEDHHLQSMKDFIDTYAKAWEHQHVLLGRVHEEFKVNGSTLTVEKLLDTFIQNKMTGTERPGSIEFEEANVTDLPTIINDSNDRKEIPILEKPSKTGDGDSIFQVPGFLGKSKRDKKKDKKKKKNKKDDDDKQNTPKVDEEGYSIRPDHPFENADQDDKNSWYSSSDSESDSEDKKKIKVEIKPFSPNGSTPTSSNVDDIRKSIEGLRLSPTSNRRTASASDPSMKRINSSSKASQDLLGLDLFGPSSSSASTPTGGNYSFPSPAATISTRENATTPTSAQDLSIGSPADTPPSAAARRTGASTPTGAPLIPGPPSRASPRGAMAIKSYNATSRPTGRQSPALTPAISSSSMNRADSLGNLNNNTATTFNTTSMPIGSSRGPSPLTIGMADNIPLAIAFSETINALFKGTDEALSRVKITGDMMVSFPAGIVKVLTENPNPATLSFRVKNIQNLEHLLVNKQLITQDTSASTSDSLVYQFEMPALTDHLRRQSETNKMASYFNIDILKYQVKFAKGRGAVGVQSTPLHLVCYWKCEPTQTDFRLDYKYNSQVCHSPLTNVAVLVPVDGQVTNMQSKPSATWSAESKRAVWKLTDISEMNEEGGSGSLRAKFDQNSGPANPSPVAVQFVCEGSSLSGVDFDLFGPGYRVSLVKKRFVTGKYLAEPEAGVKYV